MSPPERWEIDAPSLRVPTPPPQALSTEVREVQFELRSPAGASGTVVVPAYALYYVCEDVDGTCLYRRQDLKVRVRVGR